MNNHTLTPLAPQRPSPGGSSRLMWLLMTAALVACGGGGVSAQGPQPSPPPSPSPSPPPAPAPTPAPAPSTWTLAWSDEFEGPPGSAPNPAYWSDHIGNRESNGWGNRELQYYTPAPKSAALDGLGRLVIRAERAANAGPCWNGQPCAYTSARLHSQGKVNFTYGKLEARIQVPAGQGLWPAFWTLGEGNQAWPNAGEIDVMEYVGKTPHMVYGTVHGPGYSGANGVGKGLSSGSPYAQDFHVFTVIKRPNEISWQIDGVEFFRVTPASLPAGASWVFERPFYLLLNLAVGGDWPGSPDASTAFPARMTVDWVRIYKEN